MALQNLITALVLDVYDHDTSAMGVKSISCDSGSRFVRAALTYRKVPYAVGTGATVTLTVVRSDEAAVSIPGRTVDEGRIEAELTDVATAVKGTLLGQFKIEDGTQVLRTEVFKINNGVALDIDSDKWADTYQGYDLSEFEQRIIELESDTITTLIGNTPLTLPEDMNVRLVSDTPATYSLGGIVIANYDKNDGLVLNNVEMVRENGRMHFTAVGSAWDQCYVEMTIQGLVVGNSYTFKVDKGVYVSGTSSGVFDLFDGNGNYVTSLDPPEDTAAQTFTTATSNALIRFYPILEGYWGDPYNLRDCLVNGFGIYATKSGSFTKTSNLGILQAGTEISSEPSVQVYSLTQKDAVVVDEDFSATSKNPVQNRRVTAAIGSLNDLNTSAKNNLVAAINEASKSSASRLLGKRCVFLGDSISAFQFPPNDIPSMVAAATGMNVVNGAFGGCTIADGSTEEGYRAFSFAKLVEAITSGDWSYQDSEISYLTAAEYAYRPADHLSALKAVNWSNVDILVIHWAGNDPGNTRIKDPNGDSDANEDTRYYVSAFRHCVRELWRKYPQLKMLYANCTYHERPNGTTTDTTEYEIDGVKYHYYDWGDALLEECKKLKIPTLDLYRTSCINSYNVSYYMGDDLTHPKIIGNQLLANKFVGKLLSEF